MKRGKLAILIISGISFILLVLFLSLLLGKHLQVESCECPKMVSQNFIVLFILLSIIFVGGLIYYLLSMQIEKRDKKVKFNIERIMNFLDKDEKIILNTLKNQNKEITQSEIKELQKIRKHRAIKKLEEKKLINLKKIGNRNFIELNKNFKL